MAAQGMAIQQRINFSRDNEAEADRVGIGYLAGAGFDTQAMGNFFETISRHEGLAATYIPAMLVDHPVTSDRIAEARARAAQFPPRRAKDSVGYQLIRERLRVLTATGDVDIEKYYARRIALGYADLGNRYGEALALMTDNKPAEAQRILHKLTQEHEGITLLHSALGQAEAKSGQTNDALATFKHAVALFPRNVPVTVRYAEELMAAGDAKQAHEVLLDLFNNVPPTPEQIRLTIEAMSRLGARLDETKPDVLLLITGDHLEGFFLNCIAPFTVYLAEEAAGSFAKYGLRIWEMVPTPGMTVPLRATRVNLPLDQT